MKKITLVVIACIFAMIANAMPAKHGWRTVLQADGTTTEVQKMGDEFYHYTINREGKEVKLNAAGVYEVVGEAPSVEKVKARRAAGQVRRARKDVGTNNLAPRGLLILANFNGKTFKSSNSKAVMDSLVNAKNCTVNNGYGSAAQYFRDQSNGKYQPVFDVYGPVTLSKSYSYYGGNDSQGNDEYATDAVIEACILANNQYSDLNFANYDVNNDGYVDFVYVIYAGYGEADYDDENTIWPHNYSIQDIVKYYSQGWSKYQKSDTKLDGKYLDNYAMSQELDGQSGSRAGNGTFCHEFGHVIGLPDFYETNYGNNYYNAVIPNDWDIMDGGGYNGDGHCPPNYSPWEKYFFGWHTPINLGSEGALLELKANGVEGYQAYQINTSGKLEAATSTNECYYIENRQQTGWDTGLPSHGMLIWKVTYNQSAWASNAPNGDNTSGSPLYTIVSASGTKIGTHPKSQSDPYTSVKDGPKNPFPGSAKVTSKTIAGKPLLNIKESNNIITLTYIEEPTTPVDPFDIIWYANGEEFTTTTSTGKVVLPTTEPTACTGKVFVGWCANENYQSATTAPTFVQAGQAVEEGAKFYAVFATKEGEGSSTPTKATSIAVGDKVILVYETDKKELSGITGTSTKYGDAVAYTSTPAGAYLLEVVAGSASGTFALKHGTDYLQWSSGNSLNKKTTVDANSSWKISFSSGDAVIKNAADETRVIRWNPTSPRFACYTGTQKAVQLYKQGGGVSYSNYTTTCTTTDIDEVETIKYAAKKVIRDGVILILRGDAIYSITGERIK